MDVNRGGTQAGPEPPSAQRSQHPDGHNRAVAERNVQAILDAAERLLDRGSQTTISAVAAEAGLSRVTVYAHFQTRKQLLETVGERAVRTIAAALDSAGLDEGSATDAFERGLAMAWVFLEHHQAMAQATGTELDAEARRHFHESVLARVERLIERGREQGDFRTDLPAAWLLACFHALIHAAVDEVRAGRLDPGMAHEVLRRSLHDLFLPPADPR